MKYLFSKQENESSALNGIRAFSIFFVILYHYWKNVNSLLIDGSESIDVIFSNLRSGVDLFFILSGFLIYDGLLRENDKHKTIDLKIFYIKRTLRIMPAYYLCLLVTFLSSSAILKSLSQKIDPSPVDLAIKARVTAELAYSWTDFLYISNFFESHLYLFGWSLSIEEQFYLIVPALCLFLLFKMSESARRKFLVILFFIPLLFRILYTYLGRSDDFIYFHTETRFDSIMIGILAAEFLRWKPDFITKANFKLDLLGPLLAVLLLAAAFLSPHKGITLVYMYTLFQIGFVLFLLCSLRVGTFWNKFFSLSIFRPFARISYTMYLWHLPCAAIALKMLFGRSAPKMELFRFAASGFFVILASFLICIPIFYITEKPFLSLRDFLVRKLKEKNRPESAT